ncbi:MAG TPA: hypothetical protein DCX95_02305 [Elusimicrobia bacterium]|nr:hypothetical protein [Elusimicrobiota bacterium]
MKVAVVGVGSLGQHHARIYSQIPEVEFIGVLKLTFTTFIRNQYTENKARKSIIFSLTEEIVKC